ncbi:MAG: hypothetical protein DK305_001026 [Chloroflexi bacterium]|jgi:hypothetical protein|nr:MAG: hypothetical protein DK305_001026 [Chloroflexota bacterium]|tara:strand:+ start:10033 stop:10284 length:252 start_codon:yes stop_codon:yes gene_type:complete
MNNNKSTIIKSKNSRLCKHHWVISSPQGKDSKGSCKLCGREKVFSNSSESIMWEKTNTLRKTDIGYPSPPVPVVTDKTSNFEN